MKSIKVYKINDYEWWVNKDGPEEMICWYRENIDDSLTYEEMLEEVVECDLDNEGMWYKATDKSDIEKLGDNQELIGFEITEGVYGRKVQFGNLMMKDEEVYKFIPYREAIKFDLDFTEPYNIASTEW